MTKVLSGGGSGARHPVTPAQTKLVQLIWHKDSKHAPLLPSHKKVCSFLSTCRVTPVEHTALRITLETVIHHILSAIGAQ